MITHSDRHPGILRIAMPHKGVLASSAAELMTNAGFQCGSPARRLHHLDRDSLVEFVYLRARDVPWAVAAGLADAGITGRDFMVNAGEPLLELLPLGFGRSRFCYAAPADSDLRVDDLHGTRIATALAGLTARDLARRGITAEIVEMTGAVENAIHLGAADAVADIVDSGQTLAAHGLKTIGTPLLVSEAVLTATPESAKSPHVEQIVEQVSQVLSARVLLASRI